MTLKIRDLPTQDEFWIFLFLLGSAMLNWPMLSLAKSKSLVIGFFPILLYIAIVWLMLIFFAYIFGRGDWD